MSKYTDYTIIVEGCDLTGKDTLCLKLAERYNLDFVHINSHDPNDFDFYIQTMRKKNIVYSRHWVGELIYPEIYNRKGNLNDELASKLAEFGRNNDYITTLVLTCSDEELFRRLSIRGEEVENVRNNLSRINREFLENAERYHIPVVDTSKVSFEDICHYIETGEVTW